MDLIYPVVDCHVEQHRKPDDTMLMGSSSRSPLGDKPFSSKYSERLSPSINQYLLEAARQEVGVCISSGLAMFSECMSFHSSMSYVPSFSVLNMKS